MRRHQSGWGLIPVGPILLTIVTLLQSGCSSETTPNVYKNEPPTVWIAAGPPEGSVTTGYKIEFEWGGWDPDGRIDHFEYCITDNNGAFDPEDTTGGNHWTGITGNSGEFQFSADQPADPDGDDLVAEFHRSHTFFIRSVDDQGTPSPVPAYRSFTTTTLSPEVEIVVPRRVDYNPTRIPPIATFRWIATDYIDDLTATQEPDSVSWILEPLVNHNDDWNETIAWIRHLSVEDTQWGDWVWYGAPDESGKQWTTPPLHRGNYVFAIRAKDEAGAITPVFDEDKNVRRIRVNSGGAPLLTLYNTYMGSVATAVYNSPLIIMDIPAWIPIEFEWTASAEAYGGTIVGYRYGWEVVDPDDPTDWEIDWTPFPPHTPGEPARARSIPRTFYLGTHVFRVEIMDNSGFRAALEIKINIFQLPMSRSVLLVDDFDEDEWAGWDDPVGRGRLPNDEEHDVFWEDVLSDVDGFIPVADVLEVSSGDVIPLSQLADYKSIIWSVLGHVDQITDYPVLYNLIRFKPIDEWGYPGGKVETNLLALYMAAGGHLLICGQHPVSMSINDTYAPGVRFPVLFKYELDLNERGQDALPDIQNPTGYDSFPWRDLCLETMDFAYTDSDRWRDGGLVCPVYRNRTSDLANQTMRLANPLDVSFPDLSLRTEVAGPGKFYEITNQGLDCEVYNPAYFMDQTVCLFTPRRHRDCFEPIYGLGCLDQTAVLYNEPVAFWTSVHGDVVPGVPGTVSARSAVFGFPPVLFDPAAGKTAIEHILFDEWQLPRK